MTGGDDTATRQSSSCGRRRARPFPGGSGVSRRAVFWTVIALAGALVLAVVGVRAASGGAGAIGREMTGGDPLPPLGDGDKVSRGELATLVDALEARLGPRIEDLEERHRYTALFLALLYVVLARDSGAANKVWSCRDGC